MTRALFAAMREAGPLPVAVPMTVDEYLAGRRALLERRMLEVNAKAAADTLEDVRIKAGEMKITPLKAITPEAADALADRLYGMVPLARVTDLLAEVTAGQGSAAHSLICTPACPPATGAWCSPPYWPMRPTWA